MQKVWETFHIREIFYSGEKNEEKGSLGDGGLSGRNVLIYLSRQLDVKLWFIVTWLGQGQARGCCNHENEALACQQARNLTSRITSSLSAYSKVQFNTFTVIIIFYWSLLHVSVLCGSSSGRNVVTRDAYDTLCVLIICSWRVYEKRILVEDIPLC